MADKSFPGIIFDMDGTLWDSAENVAKSWSTVTINYPGIEKEVTQEDVQSVMGLTMDNIAAQLFPQLTKEKQLDALEKCCEVENEYLRIHGGILYDGTEDVFKALMKKYRLFIVSNCQAGYIEAFLDHYGLWKYIEDIECYGNNKKPKGENIRLVCERNGLEKAVYVGDIQGDYNSSVQAGTGFIHAAYGFGKIDADVPAIKSINELPQAVDNYFISLN